MFVENAIKLWVCFGAEKLKYIHMRDLEKVWEKVFYEKSMLKGFFIKQLRLFLHFILPWTVGSNFMHIHINLSLRSKRMVWWIGWNEDWALLEFSGRIWASSRWALSAGCICKPKAAEEGCRCQTPAKHAAKQCA